MTTPTDTPPLPNLTPLVQQVAAARAATTQAQLALSTARAACDAAHAPLLTALTTAKTAQDAAEEILRAATLTVFAATGSKHPHPALGVRLTTRLEYDRDRVTTWARRNMPAVLTLDIRRFEAVARRLAVPEVTVIAEPQATIGTDLHAWAPAAT